MRTAIVAIVLALVLGSSSAVAAAAGTVGEIVAYAGADAPSGWLVCDGSTLDAAEYPHLCALIDGIYGSGCTLPDLRGRTAVGAGAGAGLTARALGESNGEEEHTLTIPEMPEHSHRGAMFEIARGTGPETYYMHVWVNYNGADIFDPGVEPTGGDQPHNNMPPYLVLNYIIRATPDDDPAQPKPIVLPTPVATLEAVTITNVINGTQMVADGQQTLWAFNSQTLALFGTLLFGVIIFGLLGWIRIWLSPPDAE